MKHLKICISHHKLQWLPINHRHPITTNRKLTSLGCKVCGQVTSITIIWSQEEKFLSSFRIGKKNTLSFWTIGHMHFNPYILKRWKLTPWTFLNMQFDILNFLKCVLFFLIIDGKVNKMVNFQIQKSSKNRFLPF